MGLSILLLSTLILFTCSAKAFVPYKRAGKTSTWTAFFSEENGGFSGRQTAPIAGIQCRGDYCDDKSLRIIRDGTSAPVLSNGSLTNWFSEERPNIAFCPRDQIVNGIYCRNDYCNDVRLQCGRLRFDYRVDADDIKTTDYFSEEAGGIGTCPDGYYLWGMGCRESYCDEIKLYCARVDYEPVVNPPLITFLRSRATFLGFSRWFSEENGGYSGAVPGPVWSMECRGDYCDDKRLRYAQRSSNLINLSSTFWTGWFSEETVPNSGFCPFNMVLIEIQCRLDYCDEMRLRCGKLIDGYIVQRTTTQTLDYFSEEQGSASCPDGYYVVGMRCRNDYCDDIQLTCALVQYTS